MRGYTNERLGKWKQSKFALEQIDVTDQVRLKINKYNHIRSICFHAIDVFTRSSYSLLLIVERHSLSDRKSPPTSQLQRLRRTMLLLGHPVMTTRARRACFAAASRARCTFDRTGERRTLSTCASVQPRCCL